MKTAKVVILYLLLCNFSFAQQTTLQHNPNNSAADELNHAGRITQSFYYIFHKETAPYLEKNGGTSLNQGMTWDDPHLAIPLGFEFDFFDRKVETLFLIPEFDGLCLVADSIPIGITPAILLYDVNVSDRGMASASGTGMPNSLSPISYSTEGEEGYRICTIQFTNTGFHNDIQFNNESIDFIHMQIRIYEETDLVELHIGPNSISQPDLAYEGKPGPSVALLPGFNFDNHGMAEPGLWLSGFPESPMPVISDSIVWLQNHIVEGTIYQFRRIAVEEEEVEEESNDQDSVATGIEEDLARFQVYPNPAKESLILHSDFASGALSYDILNSQGQLLLNGEISSGEKINLTSLTPGFYIMMTRQGDHKWVHKFLKQ